MPVFQKRTLVCSIPVVNLRVSESNMSAEVGNKTLKHNFDVSGQKILVTKLAFVF